jgi:curli production assembly/transport component CsgG/holdfast attachment protein HfaB
MESPNLMVAPSFRLALLARAKIPAAVTACAMALSACVSPVALPDGKYAETIGNAPVIANPTPYSAALVCLSDYARANHITSPRIAVGRISDYTGKEESDGSGRKLTQGASLMAMSALSKAGANLVERYDTSVSELELKYANNKLISDGPAPTPGAPSDYRKIVSGQVPGSDYYLVGGITELNFNIRSSGLDAAGSDSKATGLKIEATGQLYVMNVGLDLRLVDTRTLQVVDVISYQKQIIGRQVGVGAFDVLNGNIFNVSAGEGGLEPIQLGVRAVVERAVLEMMANIYGAPGPQICLHDGDPIGGRTNGLTGSFTPAYNNLDKNNAQTREDPARWSHVAGADAAAVERSRY